MSLCRSSCLAGCRAAECEPLGLLVQEGGRPGSGGHVIGGGRRLLRPVQAAGGHPGAPATRPCQTTCSRYQWLRATAAWRHAVLRKSSAHSLQSCTCAKLTCVPCHAGPLHLCPARHPAHGVLHQGARQVRVCPAGLHKQTPAQWLASGCTSMPSRGATSHACPDQESQGAAAAVNAC